MNPAFNSATRLMMLAPHPDDESLAAGVLLQRAVAAGAAVRIVYATDGDDNPWPQRLVEKRWRLHDTDKTRWGKRRRKEAIAALSVLGMSGRDARFLGLPDQGITRMLLHDARKISSRIRQMISDWSPTHLLAPSTLDAHPDHSALAVLVQFAIDDLEPRLRGCSFLSYLVHGDHKRFPGPVVISPVNGETALKRQAISEHWTQMKFSRRRFMAYARRAERFILAGRGPSAPMKSITSSSRTAAELRLLFRFGLKPMAKGRSVFLAGHQINAAPLSLCLQLPAGDAKIQMTDCATSHRIGIANYRGTSVAGELNLSAALFAPDRPIFVKVGRGRWFFDDGWIEIPSLAVATKTRSVRHQHIVLA